MSSSSTGITSTNTISLKNKTISTGSALDANASSNFTYHSLARQAIINGNFDIWQRGTSVAMTTANAYTADRWYCETATAGTDKTVSQQDGTGVNGSYWCARVAMVQDVDELLTFSQALESQDSIKFRGQKLTLSFWARGGAEFVADNATLVSKILTGKGTDQKVLAFTTSANAVSQNNTLTTSWQKFTCTTTAVIASDITQIGVSFAFTHAGAGTTTNYFEITQVQLCAGDVALPFQPKSFNEELLDCQRYCFVPKTDSTYSIIGSWGSAVATNVSFFAVNFPVELRTTPTLTATAADYVVIPDDATTHDVTAIALGAIYTTKSAVNLKCTVGGGTLTQYRPYNLSTDGTANRVMIFDAEF